MENEVCAWIRSVEPDELLDAAAGAAAPIVGPAASATPSRAVAAMVNADLLARAREPKVLVCMGLPPFMVR